MKNLKTFLLSTLTVGLVFISSFGGGMGINCLGYFYEPKKPDLLK